MTPLVAKRVESWLTGSYDEETKTEIRRLQKEDPEKLTDSFYTDLSFGTGGMRGLMGVGPNRLNTYTIRSATQGLASYILKNGTPEKGVFIGFDSRHHSREFALECAKVLAGNKIPVFLLTEIRPTPFISFGCREKKCQAAIMITASHNPKDYNGYKVYWADGAQVVPPHDTGIMEEVKKVKESLLASADSPLITRLSDELDASYLAKIASLQHYPEENRRFGSTLKITYTSLHGTGMTLMPRALQSWGFPTLHLVKEQIVPDGDFPTVKFPNPEYPETLKLGLEELAKTGSDILIATDPDADRLAVATKERILSGNELATLALYFLLQQKLPKKSAFVTSIVTTPLFKKLASAFNYPCFEVLTGFKYIGEKIHEWEQTQEHEFIFGAEESYGYLLGTFARDKDGIVSGCLMAEIALHQKRQGKTLLDLLHEIYHRFGIYREAQISLSFEAGERGMEAMGSLMKKLRSAPPKAIGDKPVTSCVDLMRENAYSPSLPPADVVILSCGEELHLTIRPSGTEPKIKIYGSLKLGSFTDVESGMKEADRLLQGYLKELGRALQG